MVEFRVTYSKTTRYEPPPPPPKPPDNGGGCLPVAGVLLGLFVVLPLLIAAPGPVIAIILSVAAIADSSSE